MFTGDENRTLGQLKLNAFVLGTETTFEPLKTTREERGRAIAESGFNNVKRFDDDNYAVKSQSREGFYSVTKTEIGWTCSCQDFKTRGVKCKHIWAVETSFNLREQAKKVRIEPVISQDIKACLFCGSDAIVKDGVRHNKYGDVQVYYCNSCEQHFTINVGFEGMKSSPQIITTAMHLYFSGQSFRNVAKSLKLLGVKVSHVAVFAWVKKYTAVMKQYVDNLKPNVGDTWRADEVWIKVSGDMKYLFALMDDETRYWIAQEVADTKERHDATSLLDEGKQIIGRRPNTFITDGLQSYHDAYNKEFFTLRNPRTKHINTIKLAGDMNNNKMERANGEVRDREKVMRGLKKKDTAVLPGYQIFHNFIRTHEGLKGKTPAEACGIEVVGENKWITLIQNASHPTMLNSQEHPT